QLADAERAFREPLLVRNRAFGNEQWGAWTARTLGMIAFVLAAQYQDEVFDTILRENRPALPKAAATYGGLDDVLRSWGDGCLIRGDYADAEAHCRRALEVSRKNRSPIDP